MYKRRRFKQDQKFKKLTDKIHDPDKRTKLQKFTATSKEILREIKLDVQIKRQTKRIDKKLKKLEEK